MKQTTNDTLYIVHGLCTLFQSRESTLWRKLMGDSLANSPKFVTTKETQIDKTCIKIMLEAFIKYTYAIS